jgi:hypothetical protein
MSGCNDCLLVDGRPVGGAGGPSYDTFLPSSFSSASSAEAELNFRNGIRATMGTLSTRLFLPGPATVSAEVALHPFSVNSDTTIRAYVDTVMVFEQTQALVPGTSFFYPFSFVVADPLSVVVITHQPSVATTHSLACYARFWT